MDIQMELVKDLKGNCHIIYENSIDDDNQIGENLSNFEILQILSKKNNETILKVRSLNNGKIYAIKKIYLKKIENSERQNFIDEIKLLKKINNPNILKCYDYFIDKEYLYFIMEYMDNSDLFEFIKIHQNFNEKIKESKIWNVLLQCLSALDYLYKQNLGNSGIKITNIYLNNEQNAKICIFKEYNKEKNNNKSDIYKLLSKYFYSMCFSQNNRVITANSIEEVLFVKDNQDSYSNELIEIIYGISGEKQNQYNNLNNIYNKVKEEYAKKYNNNTNIESILRCLYAFKHLDSSILKNENIFKRNKNKYNINYWFVKAIKAFTGDNEDLKKCIEEIRCAIALENSNLDEEEIDPLYLLSFLLKKMHIELNEKSEKNSHIENQSRNYSINSILNGAEEDKSNKLQMINKFKNYFNENFKSTISKLFYGFLKTKRICYTCKTGSYSFSNFYLVNFYLKNKYNQQEFNLIKDGFTVEYNYAKEINPDTPEKVFCEKCLTYQKHIEFNRYYMMNHCLIISFIRESNYKTKIEFHEKLNLKNFVDYVESPVEFDLVGSIIRIVSDKDKNEKYIYYIRDPMKLNNWFVNGNRETFNHAPIEEIKQKGEIILLFYSNSKHNSI